MVYDIDDAKGKDRDFIGSNETTLGSIIGSLKQTYVGDLKDLKSTTSRGKIVVRLDNVNSSNDEARIKVKAGLTAFSSCCGGLNNPYFVLSRARDSHN